MSTCRLIEQSEFINDMNSLIDSTTKFKNYIDEFKSGLIVLKSKYENMDEFEESVREYLEDERGNYQISYVDEKIADNLKSAIDSIFKEMPAEVERESKFDSLSPTSETSIIRQRFLDKYFRVSSFSKLVFLRNFKSDLIRKLFITDEVDSFAALNNSIQDFRNSLKDQIKQVIINQLQDYKTAKRFEDLYSLNMDSAIELLKRVFDNENIFPPTLIAKLPEIEVLNEEGQELLKGWQAYVILSNFDDLLSNIFEKAIEIKNHGQYNLDNSNKYSIKTADKVIQGWRDENVDVDESEELGSIAVLFLSSLKVVDKAGNLKQEDLEFQNIKVAIGNLMKVLDAQSGNFFMYNKFPDTVFSGSVFANLKNVLLQEYGDLYGKDYLSDILQRYVLNKNFKQILAATKEHAQILMPILFRLTQPIMVNKVNINPYSEVFSKQLKTEETLRSLYKQLFSPDSNSIFSMNQKQNKGFNPNVQSIYQYITTLILNIENKQQIEYQKKEDGISVVNLGLKTNTTRLKALIRGLEGKFNKINPLGEVSENIVKFNSFSIQDNLLGEDKTIPKGLTISTENYNIQVNPDMTIQVYDLNKKLIPPKEIKYNALLSLFQEVLDIEFNPNFLNVFQGLNGKQYDILTLVSHILYNYQVGKHMINFDNEMYNNSIDKYYEYGPKKILTSKPKIPYKSVQPSTILPSDLDVIELISKTKDNIEGYSEMNTVLDGDRKQISTLGLPCLLARFSEIMENHGKQENSAIKHLSILDMFSGAEYMRDYSEPGNNKQAKHFTEPELITASILYDMYGELNNLEDGNLTENNEGILRVMGPVIADKGNLIKLKFKWNALINPKYVKVLRPDSPDTALRLRDLTISDLKYIIKQDFGEYYRNVVNYINNQYDILNTVQENQSQNYIDQAVDNINLQYNLNLPKGIRFDYLSNFVDANSAYGKYVFPILREAIYLAQQNGDSIEIVDQVHYVLNKNETISSNSSLIHQYLLFNDDINLEENYEQFWDRKEKQLFVDLLQSETELQVKNGNVNKQGVAIATAIAKNEGWIKGENIAFAKVTNGEYSQLISNKNEFKSWFPYRVLRESYNGKLPAELDIDNPDVSLESIIEALKTQSIKNKLLNKISEIVKVHPDSKKLPNTQEGLLKLGFEEYSKIRKLYDPDITEEKLIQGWDTKIQKEFIKEGKLDKKQLKTYILESRVRNDINSDLNTKYLENFIEESDNFNVEINPEIIKHNLYDYYLSEEFVLATTGTWAAHPAKSNDLITREAEQFGQAVKRYVSYTASMHREELNTLNGIPEDLILAIIEDDTDTSYNFVGEKGRVKTFDGATYVCSIMNYLENNSLGADAMGVDKKCFGHHQGVESGIGFILKTAGFAITNARIRAGMSQSGFDARLNKKMLDIKWDSPKILKMLNGETLDWTKDYFGNNIDYGEWYAYDLDEENTWRWYKRRINKDTGNIEQILVYQNGQEYNSDWKPYSKTINSNYDLWQAFGGAYSGHVQKNDDGTLSLVYDEGSVQMLVKAVNNVGIRRKVNGKYVDKVFDQDGVNQILKKACIHLVPTGGAVKYGGANINSKEAYYNDDYHLTTMSIKAYNYGIQLNAEHTAEDGHVALMTQVINALTARGYSYYEGKQCYEALASIAEYIAGDVLQAMESDDPALIEEAINKSIYKTLLKTSSTDGDVLNALANSILDINSSTFDKSEIIKKFPISHPAVFSKIMSSLSSQLEKAIKLTFEGGMEVLNPSNRRFTVINGQLSGYYETHIDELQALENKNKRNPLKSAADIRLGYNYRNSETGELFKVSSPSDLYELKERILNGQSYYETVLTTKDGVILPLGRDLATYQFSFIANGQKYNSWELDSVRMLQDYNSEKDGFLIPNSETEEEKVAFMAKLQENWNKLSDFQKAYNAFSHPELIGLLNTLQQEEVSALTLPQEILERKASVEEYLRDSFQKDLNAISSGIETTVKINGQDLKVNKQKVEILPFEIILPMIYKTMFGLKEGDNVQKIKENQNFFIRRQLDNWKSKISDQSVFDIELKCLDGNHIYLGLPPEDLLGDEYQAIKLEFPSNFELDGDTLYRITPLGKRLYSVPYTVDENGFITPDIQVYKHKASGTEIIYSNNLTHFLDEFNYNKIIFSQEGTSDKGKLLQQLNGSTNSTARRKISILVDLANQRIDRKIKLNDKEQRELFNTLIKGLFGVDEVEETLEDGTLEELIQYNLEDLTELIVNDFDYTEKQLEHLKQDLTLYTGNDLVNRNKFFKGLILSGIDVHTSFLQSLEMVVSRTPAQSHQSFMAMSVVAFGPEQTNSAYVSKDQLWLQGSDYDIDKISLLGLKFKFGKLVTWSPFFSLQSKEAFEASKKLPFPTSKELRAIKTLTDQEIIKLSRLQQKENLSQKEQDELNDLSSRQILKRPYDVIKNDFIVTYTNGNIIISLPSGNSLTIQRNIFGIDLLDRNNVTIVANNWDRTPKLEKYLLLRRLRQELEGFEGTVDFANFDIGMTTRAALGFSGDGYIEDINRELDFIDFNETILPESLKEISNIKYVQNNIIGIAPNIGLLIDVYNKIGYIPQTSDQYHVFIKSLVDYHNLSIKGSKLKDSLYNFVSIKAKDISKDPINRIQAQAPIDPQQDKIKALVEKSEKYPEFQKLAGFIKKFDRGSIYSKIKMLTITLGGKDGVGIEASSLKNFEMSSQYNYQILEEGTAEDQRDLLFKVIINGREVNMLANVRVRNEDTIKDQQVLEALRKVNQYRDEFLTKSGLLSLSTDNAKDPKLPQLNCGKKMLSLYDAGVNLGFTVEELAKLILSDTGILLNKLASGNVFNEQLEKSRVLDIIRQLDAPPRVNLTDKQLLGLKPLFVKLGIYQQDETINNTNLSQKLANPYLRNQFLQIFRFLQAPNAESSILKEDKERLINNIIANLKRSKDYIRFSQRSEEYLNELSAKERTQEEEVIYNKLLERQRKKQEVLDDIQNWRDYRDFGSRATENIEKFDVAYKESLNDNFQAQLSNIKSLIFESKRYLSNIKSIYNWLNNQEIIDNDLIEGYDGRKHKILNQLRKLAEIAEEQSSLRFLMALNQSLPNKVEDQLEFYTNLSKILSDRLEIIGKSKLEKYYSDVLSELEQLASFNAKLRENGDIYSDNKYYVDLHTFLYNPQYNSLVKSIYGKVKCTTNIFKVIDTLPNYNRYLKLADALPKVGMVLTQAYRALKLIEDSIIPGMKTKKSNYLTQMRRNANPYIYRKLNQEFLRSLGIQVTIPRFKIENGRLIYLQGKPQTIQLGINEKDDQKFKEYVQHIVFPELKRNYPNNKFIQYLGYRSYDYNSDHNSSINLAKIKTSDMKNPSDVIQFDLAKYDLQKLPVRYVNYLFFYNLIAYNNQAGQLSLTSLFEDLIAYNQSEIIQKYNDFIVEWGKTDSIELNQEEIKRQIAPVLKLYEVSSRLQIPYIYVENPEDKITYFCWKKISQNYNQDENDDLDNDNDWDENDDIQNGDEGPVYRKKSFEQIMNEAGYYIQGRQNNFFDTSKEAEMDQIGKYKISKNTNLKELIIIDKDITYTSDDILRIAKEKKIKLSEKEVKTLSQIFPKKNKKKYDLSRIQSYLDVILHDDTTC